MMAEYLPLENFKTIYVVDLCKSLCEQAKKKVDANGWKNVVVVEGDACTFTPPSEKVTLVTFSYSLSSESLLLLVWNASAHSGGFLQCTSVLSKAFMRS